MKKHFLIRHGDLIVKAVDTIPEGLPLKDNTVLLDGELTGHRHALSGGTVYTTEATHENDYLLGYFRVDKPTPLTHPEHKTIEIPAGNYKFLRQVEFDPQQERQVKD